jgi:hypothetical protein
VTPREEPSPADPNTLSKHFNSDTSLPQGAPPGDGGDQGGLEVMALREQVRVSLPPLCAIPLYMRASFHRTSGFYFRPRRAFIDVESMLASIHSKTKFSGGGAARRAACSGRGEGAVYQSSRGKGRGDERFGGEFGSCCPSAGLNPKPQTLNPKP